MCISHLYKEFGLRRRVGNIYHKGIVSPLYFKGWEQGSSFATVMRVMEEKIHMFLDGQSGRFGPLGEKVSWEAERAMPDEVRQRLQKILNQKKKQ